MKLNGAPSPEKQIGVGGYKRAYLIEKEGKAEVHLVFKDTYTPQQIKGLFYLNKIATALFPEHIVKVTQVGNTESGEDTTTHAFTEYVTPDAQHVALQNESLKFDFKSVEDLDTNEEIMAREQFNHLNRQRQTDFNKVEVSKFINSYEKSGLVAGFGHMVRWGPQDLILKSDGNFIFVDIDVAWDEPEDMGETEHTNSLLRFDPKKLQESISHLSEPMKSDAQSAYDRLIVLCREAGFTLDSAK